MIITLSAPPAAPEMASPAARRAGSPILFLSHRRHLVCALGGGLQGYGAGLGMISILGPAAPFIAAAVGCCSGRVGRLSFKSSKGDQA